MKLIIAEKYKVAQCFAKVLKCDKKNTTFDKGIIGYFYNDEWIVSWAAGHLVEMVYPDKYSDVYKSWDINNLPIIPKDFKYEISKFGKKQFNALKGIMKGYTIDSIYHAADADREGELIVREILRELKVSSKIKCYRVWYTNTTDTVLLDAVKNAKPLSDYDNLFYAADCRQKLDWLFGINLSRAYTSKLHSTQNVGRVISPTINLVVQRQKEIDEFKPEDYAVITVPIKKDSRKLNVEARFDDVKKAKELAPKLKGRDALIKSVDSFDERESRKLFNTTQLQAEASKKFNYSPEETMKIMQNLYEQGYMSYPRTKSCSINKEQKDETESLLIPAYELVFKKSKNIDPKTFDIMQIIDKQGSSAEEASHTGLCPTMKGIREYSRFKDDDKLSRIFLTITGRLICAVMPPRIVAKTKVLAEIEKEIFQGNGSVEKESGFYAFEQEMRKLIDPKFKSRASDTILPDVNVGEIFTCMTAKCVEKKTKPPEQYTIDQLLSAMENISRAMSDKKLKDAMKDGGLGTPASRDGVIKTMQSSEFVELKQKRLYPTEKAKKLMSMLDDSIKSPSMTANMEIDLDKIASGDGDAEALLRDVEKRIRQQIDFVKSLPEEQRAYDNSNKKVFMKNACPRCGADVVEAEKLVSCRDNCGFKIWRTIAKKKISKDDIKSLIQNGHTVKKIEGLKSSKGSKFSCYLYLDENKDVKFDFNGDKSVNSKSKPI